MEKAVFIIDKQLYKLKETTGCVRVPELVKGTQMYVFLRQLDKSGEVYVAKPSIMTTKTEKGTNKYILYYTLNLQCSLCLIEHDQRALDPGQERLFYHESVVI